MMLRQKFYLHQLPFGFCLYCSVMFKFQKDLISDSIIIFLADIGKISIANDLTQFIKRCLRDLGGHDDAADMLYLVIVIVVFRKKFSSHDTGYLFMSI